MVVITAAFGWLMGIHGNVTLAAIPTFLLAMIGIGLGSAGSAVLNNFLEREHDAGMERTKGRELPQGIIDPANALAFGIGLMFISMAVLLPVSLLVAFLVLLTSFLYVIVYTPLKRITWWNTSIGAIPGALPMSIGWVAASGTFDFGAWVVFAILYAWQHPHFYAIAWMYADDYERAGYKMLSVTDKTGHKLCLQVILYSALLLAVSIVPSVLGDTGLLYLVGALLLGIFMLVASAIFVKSRSRKDARKLLFASIIYLPALLGVLALDTLLAVL